MLKSACGVLGVFAVVLLSARAARAAPGHVFLPVVNVTSPAPLDGCAMGDLDGDGHPDVVAVGGDAVNPMAVYEFHNDGTGKLSNTAKFLIGGAFDALPVHSIGIGDFNGDGRPDIVAGQYGGIAVFLQTASGGFSPVSVIKSNDYQLLRVGDLNHDGKPDVVAETWMSNTVSVFYQTASGLSAPKTYSVVHNGREDLDLGDVNGDGLTDIVITTAQQLTNEVAVLLQQPGGGFAPAQYYNTPNGSAVDAVAVGDVTRDGLDDVVTQIGSTQQLAVFPQTAQGTLGTPTLSSFPFQLAEPLDIVDLTGDGHGDVLEGGNAPYLSQPDGSFVAAPTGSAFAAGVHSTCPGDLDGDGKIDSVVSGVGGLYVLYGTRTDLSVDVTDKPDPVLSAADLTFTATITNHGPDDATKVKLTVTPPSPLSLDTFTPSQGTCSVSSCALGALAVGASATVTVTAMTSGTGTDSTQFSVAAYNYDQVATNNTQTVKTTVLPSADLDLILGTAYGKNGLEGVIGTVGNAGPYPADGAQLVFDLPPGVSYASSDGSCQSAGGQVTCALGTVPIVDAFSGTPPQIHLMLGGSGTITAKVSATTGDPNLVNNQATIDFASGTSGTGGAAGLPPTGPGGPLAGNSGGCGCELAGGSTGNPLLLLLLGAGLLVRRRRTRV